MITYQFIVELSKENVSDIINLYKAEGWWSVDDDPAVIEEIVKGSHCFLAALKDGGVIGMGRAISDKYSDAYIQDVTVNKAFRGQGIGTEIIKRLVSRLELDGLGWIGLIAENNSHPFYKRLGFSPMTDSVPMLRKK